MEPLCTVLRLGRGQGIAAVDAGVLGSVGEWDPGERTSEQPPAATSGVFPRLYGARAAVRNAVIRLMASASRASGATAGAAP